MMWRDVVGLVAVTQQKAPYNALIDVDGVPREVPANKKSTRQSEFYQARAVGIKPELTFEVFAGDYQDEPKLMFDGTTYYIIRTFSKSGEKLELICSRFPMESVGGG